MSTKFASTMKTLAAGMGAATFLFVQQAAAVNDGITRFRVKNCTDFKVLVCTFNKDDNVLALPYDYNKVEPSKKERASCGSPNRCKVFTVISSRDYQRVKNQGLLGQAGSWGGAGLAAGAGAAVAANAGLTLATGGTWLIVVAGSVAGSMAVGAVIDDIEAANAAKTCANAVKDMKKAISEIPDAKVRKEARDGLKRNVSGTWPKYEPYSYVMKNGVPALVKGDKC